VFILSLWGIEGGIYIFSSVGLLARLRNLSVLVVIHIQASHEMFQSCIVDKETQVGSVCIPIIFLKISMLPMWRMTT